ncbi:MAG: dethiobiotin synthase [Piscirickettsiaceae bacterium]|jgi:dethiobiotin synthetase|nr:dethiobiotin synthase [Piscirickettsiaceae bacterium]
MTDLFVTGTDTDVGKTRISVALISLLAEVGHQVAGMKPIASGCEVTAQGLRNHDAVQLSQQATIKLPYDLINPYAFEPAIAPHIAAEQVGVQIKIDVIQQHFEQIKQQADSVVVEGAGGWLVPINQTLMLADIAVRLDLPVVLVVGIRLGCINHALLTVESIKQRGLSLYGWVANHVVDCAESAAIIATLKTAISSPCLGVVPVLAEKEAITTIRLLA